MEESRIVSALFFLLVILVWYACRGTSPLLDTNSIKQTHMQKKRLKKTL